VSKRGPKAWSRNFFINVSSLRWYVIQTTLAVLFWNTASKEKVQKSNDFCRGVARRIGNICGDMECWEDIGNEAGGIQYQNCEPGNCSHCLTKPIKFRVLFIIYME
jgi:hypothetical protein